MLMAKCRPAQSMDGCLGKIENVLQIISLINNGKRIAYVYIILQIHVCVYIHNCNFITVDNQPDKSNGHSLQRLTDVSSHLSFLGEKVIVYRPNCPSLERYRRETRSILINTVQQEIFIGTKFCTNTAKPLVKKTCILKFHI